MSNFMTRIYDRLKKFQLDVIKDDKFNDARNISSVLRSGTHACHKLRRLVFSSSFYVSSFETMR